MNSIPSIPQMAVPDRSHFVHRSKDGTDVWLTPDWILKALGEFNLDPCAAIGFQNRCALHGFTENGMREEWFGRVWCNPPYSDWGKWLEKCRLHGNAVALIFARTGSRNFQRLVLRESDGILFLRGKVSHLRGDGSQAGNATAYSCLIAYGASNADCLRSCGLPGTFICPAKMEERIAPLLIPEMA